MTTVIEFDSLSILRDPLDLLGQKPLTPEQKEAAAALVKRMRELTTKMPPVILATAFPHTPTAPVDLMFSFDALSKEGQQLLIQRSKQRFPTHLKSTPSVGQLLCLRKEDKDV